MTPASPACSRSVLTLPAMASRSTVARAGAPPLSVVEGAASGAVITPSLSGAAWGPLQQPRHDPRYAVCHRERAHRTAGVGRVPGQAGHEGGEAARVEGVQAGGEQGAGQTGEHVPGAGS